MADDVRPDEDGLIARFFAPLARDPGAFRLTDDAATLAVPEGMELVITKDALVEGIHFFPGDDPRLLGRKALRTNLSDLAAKGAEPRGYLLAIALPESWTVAWLQALVDGLAIDQDIFDIVLLGGDTTKSPGPLMISITALGLVPAGRMPRRAGARPGDLVCVTGTIGDSAIGCRLIYERDLAVGLDEAHLDHLLARYWIPEPRNALANAFRDHAGATMDVSDGLAGDLAKLCRVSGVGAEIDVGAVPLSSAARAAISRHPDLLRTALTGGDDYEVLFTATPDALDAIRSAAAGVAIDVTPIGRVVAGQGARFQRGGMALDLGKGSFSHF
jgi:thiamine-monophosphate kinase